MAEESLVEPAYALAGMRRLLPAEAVGADASDPPDSGDADDEAREAADADLIDAGCAVWDLTANAGLAEFMCEHGLPALLLRPIRARRRHSVRLVEVCVGALANLAGSEQPLRALTHPEAIGVLCELLMSTTAAPVLLALVRLFATALAPAHSDPAGLSAWLLALSSPPSLGQLASVLANTLRAELMEGCAALLRALLAHDAAAARAERPADAVPAERVHALLVRAELMPSLADLLVAHWRPRGERHDGERLLALLALFDAMLCQAAAPLRGAIDAAGLSMEHAVWRTLPLVVQRDDDVDRACVAAGIVATLVGEGAGERYLLDAPLVLALLRRLLPRCEEGFDGPAAPRVADELADGARAAWAVVHASCAELDGLAISLDLGADDSEQCRLFWALMRAAGAFRQRVRWARRCSSADMGAVATAAADALLAAAGVVGTALGAPLSGCDEDGEPQGAPREDDAADGGGEPARRRQQTAGRPDDDGGVLFRAMGALRSCFDDDDDSDGCEPLAPGREGRADDSHSDSGDCGWEWEPQDD